MEMGDRLTYDVAQVAKILGLSKNSTYHACLTGDIPHLRIGHRILIPRIALEKMLAEASKPKGISHDG